MDYDHIFERDFKIEVKKRSGIQWQGRCPLPNHEDRKASFSWNIDNGLWKCHGCFESGNAYQLAEMLGIANPSQYIDKESGGYRNNPPPIQKVNKMSREKLNNLKERYHSNLDEQDTTFTKPYIIHGKRDDGNLVFFLPDAIKHHKSSPYWEGNNKKCQIFGSEYLTEIDVSDTLYIFEGEKEVCYSPYKGISFTAGAGNVPYDLSQLYPYKNICIIPDNDDAGYKGADKWASVFANKWGASVRIAQWDKTLPKGYDVYDDYFRTTNGDEDYLFDETDKAIVNAILYEPTKTELDNNLGDFSFMKSKDMRDAEIKQTEWYVDGILPKGFNSMIAGTTGSKKSLYAMQLAMCLANGENNFCGGKIDKQYKVMYVDTEVGANEFQRRFQRIIAHMNWRGDEYFRAISRHGRTTDIWENTHKAISIWTPDLLIIDCLYNSTSIDDLSKSGSVQKITDALSDFKAKRGVDMLVIHHFTKGNHDTFTLDRISGASQLMNWVEYAMLMVRSNRDDLNLWKIGKARGVPHNQNVYGLYWDDFWFIEHGIIDDIAPFMLDKHAKNKYANILDGLADDKFDRKDWINVFYQEYPDMSERTGDTWLRKCLEARMIKKVANGIYEKHLRLINEENIDN